MTRRIGVRLGPWESPSHPRPFSFLFLAASEMNEQASLEAV